MLFRDLFTRRTSHISKLPNELLRDIFLHTRAQGHKLTTPHGLTAPWSFLSVCHQWANIALSTPELWDSLLIEFDGKEDVELLLPHLKLYLDCGKGRPLDFTLRINIELDFRLTYRPFLHLLAPLASRWRNVSIYAQHFVVNDLKNIQGGFPLLESFKLDAPVPIEDLPNEVPTIILAPKLHTLDLGRITNFDFIFPQVGSRLRQYTSSGDHLEHLYRLLVMTTNLVSAEIVLDSDYDLAQARFFWLGRSPAMLSKLKSLVITSKDLAHFEFILPCLRVPNLTNLQLRCDSQDTLNDPTPMFSAAILQLIHNSQCELEGFGVSGIPLHNGFLLSFMLRTPTLRSLTIPGPSIATVLSLLMLFFGLDNPTLLPLLEDIHIDWYKGTNILTETFKNWLQRQTQMALVARQSQSRTTKAVAAARVLLRVKECIYYHHDDIAIWGFFLLLVFVDLARALYHVYT